MKNMHHSTNEFSLFVGDLPHDCSDDKLQRLFQQTFKSVKRVQIIRNEDGSSRGFGFIRFEDRAEFDTALSKQMKIGDVTLRLDTAHTRENRYKNRSRYNSFNSTGHSNSNHHHFNNSNNHHHHHSQHHQQQQQQQHTSHQNQVNKKSQSDSGSGVAGSQPQQQRQQQPQQQQQQQQHQLSQSPASQNSHQVNNNGSNATGTTSNANHSSALPNNLSINQQAIGPDLRAYTAPTMMDTHVLSSTEQPSMMTPTSVYGHPVYPYGPPPFGYMQPPPQPNPVIPISAVPPAPPNQASPSAVVNQQHGHTMSASSNTRYGSGQHHHQQHQPHAIDGGLNSMPSGVQAQHQGPPLYYYYPPLYFDQTGGAGAAPPSIYHTQPMHPQFFAMPNPAYMPNAHTFNQHQAQPPTASQSDATVINQQQPHQQPVNMRTRDIDTTVE